MTTTARIPRSLTAEERRRLSGATRRVERAQVALDVAVAERHRLWTDLHDAGVTQREVAVASGVIRQAVGWAIAHRSPRGL